MNTIKIFTPWIVPILLGFALITYLSWAPPSHEKLTRAFETYTKGENARFVEERQTNFNQALKLYTELNALYAPTFGNGKIDYNIANCYFQLEQYPWAILHYNRSLKLRPRAEKVRHNLKLAQEKLGVDQGEIEPAFERIFFFHYSLSLPERLRLFFIFSLIVFIFATWNLWNPRPLLAKGMKLAFLFASIVLLSLGYTHYLEPVEGVLIRATPLYRDAGKQYAKVIEEPVRAGFKVEVLEVLKEGKWLKIVSPDGSLGHIPSDSVQLI